MKMRQLIGAFCFCTPVFLKILAIEKSCLDALIFGFEITRK